MIRRCVLWPCCKPRFACGRAHVADRRGRAPDEAALWGWQRKPTGGRWIAERHPNRLGGWKRRIPGVGGQLSSGPGTGGSDHLVGDQTLRRRLRERGLLASIDEGRQMVQVRRTLEGSPRQVLHLKASVLVELRAQPSAGRTNQGCAT